MEDKEFAELLAGVGLSAPDSPRGAPPPQSLFPGKLSKGGNDPKGSSPSDELGLLYFDSTEDVSSTCSGFIDDSLSRFCSKPCLPGSDSCSVEKHKRRKFVIYPQSFYIKHKSTGSAYCQPVLKGINLSSEQIANLLKDKRSATDWSMYINKLNIKLASLGNQPPKDTNFSGPSTATRLPLQTPAKVKLETTDVKSEPQSPADPDLEPVPSIPDDAEEDWQSLPSSFRTFFKLLVSNVSSLHDFLLGAIRGIQGLEKMHRLISVDLDILDNNIQEVQGQLGLPFQAPDFEAPNVWTVIDILLKSIRNNVGLSTDLSKSLKNIDQTSKGKFNGLREFCTTHSNYWSALKPWIRRLQEIMKELGLNPPSTVSKRISDIESILSGSKNDTSPTQQTSFDFVNSEINSLLATNVASNPSTKGTPILNQIARSSNVATAPELSSIIERIIKLEDMSNSLQQRTSGGGVSLGGFNFQSVADLQSWLDEHFQSHRFVIFVDGVSTWEYFYSNEYSELKDFLSEDFGASRIGFRTIHEARVANSFRTILPSVLGKGKGTSSSISGLPKPENWNNQDSKNGLFHQLTNEHNNVRDQILSDINMTESNHSSQPRQLAMECLQHSLVIINELSSFITRFHTELLYSSTYSKDQCWSLVSRCVKRVCKDMADVRITAKDIKDSKANATSATRYIWATLKTHVVMREYINKNFEDHPALASVMTPFVTHNNLQSNIKELTTKAEKIDVTIKISKAKLTNSLIELMHWKPRWDSNHR